MNDINLLAVLMLPQPYLRYNAMPSLEGFLRIFTSLRREERARERNERKQTVKERRYAEHTGHVVLKWNKRCHDTRSR